MTLYLGTNPIAGGGTVDQTYDGTSTNAQSGTAVAGLLAAIYPVGSIYIGTQNTCPMSTVMSGTTWTLVSSGKALWTGNGTNGNTTIAAGLPNIKTSANSPSITSLATALNEYTDGPLKVSNPGNWNRGTSSPTTNRYYYIGFDASGSSSIYGNSTTVQPPAYVVNVWRRTA